MPQFGDWLRARVGRVARNEGGPDVMAELRARALGLDVEAIRTPWPSRSAPANWRASQIDGSPNDSPAWIVMWKFSRRMYSNASR